MVNIVFIFFDICCYILKWFFSFLVLLIIRRVYVNYIVMLIGCSKYLGGNIFCMKFKVGDMNKK